MRLLLGTISVESGQLLIVDPANLSKWVHGEFDLANAEKGDNVPFLNNYDEACRVTYQKTFGQVFNQSAVVSATYWGDGTFNVYGDIDEDTGRPTRIVIELHEKDSNKVLNS